MKAILTSDTHFGVRNDSQLFLEYFREYYDNVFFPYLIEHDIKTVFHLGDLFDRRKYTNHVTLYHTRQMLFDRLAELGIDVHIIVGNHDTAYKNTNRVNSPELLLQDYSNVTVYTEPQEIDFDGTKILLLPWINSENYDRSIEAVESAKADVLFGHLELQGFQMHRGQVMRHGMSPKIFKNFDLVCSGHYHHKSSQGNIQYLGAPVEMTWSDYNDPRGFHVFDTSDRSLNHIVNPYKMFTKVVYDDDEYTQEQLLEQDFGHVKGRHVKLVVKTKNNPYVFDLFVDAVNDANPSRMQIVEDISNLESIGEDDVLDEAQDTLAIVKKYIGGLGFDQKESMRVEDLFHELYNEALSVE